MYVPSHQLKIRQPNVSVRWYVEYHSIINETSFAGFTFLTGFIHDRTGEILGALLRRRARQHQRLDPAVLPQGGRLHRRPREGPGKG